MSPPTQLARCAVVISLALLPAASLACSTLLMGGNERFIRGTWTHATDLGDSHGTHLELTFTPGYFRMEAYTPLEHAGRYQVASALGNSLTLRLTQQAGDLPTDDRDMLIVIDRAAGTLTIDNGGPYPRSGP